MKLKFGCFNESFFKETSSLKSVKIFPSNHEWNPFEKLKTKSEIQTQIHLIFSLLHFLRTNSYHKSRKSRLHTNSSHQFCLYCRQLIIYLPPDWINRRQTNHLPTNEAINLLMLAVATVTVGNFVLRDHSSIYESRILVFYI